MQPLLKLRLHLVALHALEPDDLGVHLAGIGSLHLGDVLDLLVRAAVLLVNLACHLKVVNNEGLERVEVATTLVVLGIFTLLEVLDRG